jgi:CHASE1-domain containing sensor protein
MSSPRNSSLTLWMSASVAVFVLVGSLALLLVFQVLADREERAAFEALARANAAFLERTPLPQSEQMAAQLGEVMGARVFFWHASISAVQPSSCRAAPTAAPRSSSSRAHSKAPT